MRAAYIECQAGASGDMFLGAWLDLGIHEDEWRAIVEALKLDGIDVSVYPVFKQGIRGLKVDVKAEGDLYPDLHQAEHSHELSHNHHHDDHGRQHDHQHDHQHEHADHHHSHEDHNHHPHRGLREIEEILDNSELPDPVRNRSKEAFRHLAEAEGYIHGLPPDQVHFHEVGAMDAIVDIVGAMAGWYLAGMPECYVSPIEVGGGTVHCAHGLMPVPAPATAVLLQGLTTYSSGTWGETVTPTGAAVLKTLCHVQSRPAMSFDRVGYGAGSKDLPAANLLRIQTGVTMEHPTGMEIKEQDHRAGPDKDAGDAENTIAREPVIVLEANVDDMTPEWISYTADRILVEGALDVWVSQVVMKKGRPGHVFHVLCSPKHRRHMENLLLTETTTIGVRGCENVRRILDRDWRTVRTKYGNVRMKIATEDGRIRNAAPEYEDCKALAVQHGIPLKQVYQAASLALSEQTGLE